MGNAVDWFVDRHVREGRGDKIAFIDPWRALTYGELDTATRRFASALTRAGIQPEQRVVILLLDTVDFPIAFWGCLRAGVIPVPINTLLTPDMIAYILADSRAEAVIVSAPLVAGLPNVRRMIVSNPDGSEAGADFQAFLASGDPATPTLPRSSDEVAFWLYSSGSTGAPKGVRHVHASLRDTADTYAAQVLGIRSDDVMFSVAKAFHAYGLSNSLTFPMAQRPMPCWT
jgi:4-hydroxybenzoate-CoA ligase